MNDDIKGLMPCGLVVKSKRTQNIAFLSIHDMRDTHYVIFYRLLILTNYFINKLLTKDFEKLQIIDIEYNRNRSLLVLLV